MAREPQMSKPGTVPIARDTLDQQKRLLASQLKALTEEVQMHNRTLLELHRQLAEEITGKWPLLILLRNR